MATSEVKASLGTSIVRTVVLPSVLYLLAKFAVPGFGGELPEFVIDLLAMVIAYGGYAVIRFLEVFASPKWGYILGLPGAPVYVDKQLTR